MIGKSIGNLIALIVVFLKWGFDEMLIKIEKCTKWLSIEVIPKILSNTRYYENKRIQERAIKHHVDTVNRQDINLWKGTDFTPYE
ncbi:uncharacterized protein METZ01_LOCUS266667 [marine metagenome]|uniref:Uncharacterized protein n=1 Tax=marine metagenome TaxID=408172 RepID=A0A382JRH0_9ZZZZ